MAQVKYPPLHQRHPGARQASRHEFQPGTAESPLAAQCREAGHTGSLDPLATGVLPLCFGEATKFSQYLLDADKGYETVMRMGITTTTGDAEGELLAERDVTVGRDDLEQACRASVAT